jgi:exonuclease VII small subunit
MDLFKIITELEAEKHRLDEAIEALERLAGLKISRRGRPPKSLKQEKHRELGTASSKAGKSTRTRVENL